MLPGELLAGELSTEEKLQFARGAAEVSSQQQLNLLISLASDPEAEVCRAARKTLSRLPDEQCAPLLGDRSLPDPIARYFLDPATVRPALLPILLANPASPQDAITTLAANAGPEALQVLLEKLDLLKTPVLVALKENPLHRRGEKQPPVEAPVLAPEEKLPAARGELGRAGPQQLSILISLAADSDEEIRSAARQTLSQLPEEQCAPLLGDPSLPESVARYFLDPATVRPALLPLLLANPASPQDAIADLAANAGPEALPVLLEELDLLKTPALVALKGNPTHANWQKEPPAEVLVLEVDLLEMLIQEMDSEGALPPAAEVLEAAEQAEVSPAGPGKPAGIYAKIAKMTVPQRLKLALRGSKDERTVLIRDGSKVVARAVLSSPKLTDGEVENFSSLKSVSQEVLRYIAMNRKFIKNYTVLKNLVNNSRLPIDVGLTLLNRLILNDLRSLSTNKNIPDTTRKMAEKLYKSRTH